MNRPLLVAVGTLAVAFAVIVIGGCNADVFLHQTASLGGDTPGERGQSQVLFINNTPHRVIFTFGTYDDFDENTNPELVQFSPEASRDLEADESSSILTVDCARVYSIGGDTMRRLATENLDDEDVIDEALVPGAFFSAADIDGENAALPTAGRADALDLWLGPDFPCDCLLVFRFEPNDVGDREFRIDYEVIPRRDD